MSVDRYASRVGDDWEMVAREEPTVWGEIPGPLSPEQVKSFDENGFLYLEGLFSEAEAATLLAEAERIAREADRSAPEVITEPGSDAVRSIFRLHRDCPGLKKVFQEPRIVDAIRQLLGSEVYVHQSRINFKPGFEGKEFYWHSDFETWHVEDGMPTMRAISVSLSLTESNRFNGPLMVIPGSHRSFIRCVGETPKDHYKASLKKQEIGVPSREALAQLVERGGLEAPTGPAGSALFFDCNLMHASSGNLSPYPRSNLFMVFNSVENRLEKPFGDIPPRPDFLAEREIVPIASL